MSNNPRDTLAEVARLRSTIDFESLPPKQQLRAKMCELEAMLATRWCTFQDAGYQIINMLNQAAIATDLSFVAELRERRIAITRAYGKRMSRALLMLDTFFNDIVSTPVTRAYFAIAQSKLAIAQHNPQLATKHLLRAKDGLSPHSNPCLHEVVCRYAAGTFAQRERYESAQKILHEANIPEAMLPVKKTGEGEYTVNEFPYFLL